MSTSIDSFVGKVLEGRFEIISLIGKGGMSAVFKARHRQVNLPVAIKILLSHHLSDQQNRERFKMEARAVNSLNHPNIMGVIAFGLLSGGEPYLVLEFLQGRSLAEIIKEEGRLPVERAIRLFIQVCNGLAHAHEKGVLHRDLKPNNIMLVEAAGQAELVKIVDFGLAKLLPKDGREAQQLTAEGQTFGSPLYMSPEQCLGQELDARSDIYSLGCSLYETLTGQPPLLGANAFQTMTLHLSERPLPMSQLAEDLRIPESLERIVSKALEKKPEQRYQTMRELLDDLMRELLDDLMKASG